MRFIADGRTLSRDDAWRNMALILGRWQLRGYGLWAVKHRESRKLIGRIGFWNPEGWPGFELGWLLGRSYWGKGYATEGARRAMEYGFRELGRKRIISLIRPDNGKSVRVAERLGKRYRGTVEVMGAEAMVYGIEKSEWSGI